ncbi:DUF4238 domain-containing protein [Rossellomorea marisflavi]|uniref:DUF4238 domain-containing protein n=1 Tax=Rossellomorea marisflavi TaxID=189381 RepID=UPI00203C06F6|nr:DUF4238 domain-containing protein [Rossellomorea marisflavi]MCM2590491.1 DUF4238 domain-containing protein [Rossellomorea marisflavi]
MSHPVKQHIVPQTYLKKFSIDLKDIWVYQKDTNNFRYQRIKNVPIIKDFYTAVTDMGEKLYDIEYLFSEDIEPDLNDYVSFFINRDFNRLTFMKKKFAYFIASQKLRTVKMRNIIDKEIEVAFKTGEPGEWFDDYSVQEFATTYFYKGEKITLQEFKERADGREAEVPLNVKKDCYLQFFPDKLIRYAEELTSQSWSYLFAPQGRAFITSDNPVIIESEIDDPTFPLQGGIFPLTKEIALNLNAKEETFRTLGAKEMRKVNQQIVRNSHRFLFSHDEAFLKHNVEKYI